MSRNLSYLSCSAFSAFLRRVISTNMAREPRTTSAEFFSGRVRMRVSTTLPARVSNCLFSAKMPPASVQMASIFEVAAGGWPSVHDGQTGNGRETALARSATWRWRPAVYGSRTSAVNQKYLPDKAAHRLVIIDNQDMNFFSDQTVSWIASFRAGRP